MSRVESQSTRTYTVREGDTVKTITERTVTTADGKTTTYREEKTETGGGGSSGACPAGMDRDAMMARFNNVGGGHSSQGGGFHGRPGHDSDTGMTVWLQ